MLEALLCGGACVDALVWRRLCGGAFLCSLCLGYFGGVLMSGCYYIVDSIVLGPLLYFFGNTPGKTKEKHQF